MSTRLLFALLPALLALPASAERVVLVGGDVLRGEIRERDEQRLVLEHPDLGVIELPADAVAEVLPDADADLPVAAHDEGEPAEAAAAAAAPAAPEAPPPSPGLFGTGFMAGWKRQIGAGLSGTEGNSVTLAANTEALFEVEDDARRWHVAAAYFFGSSDRKTDKDQAFFDAQRDWKRPDSRWFWFGRGRYEYDRFKAFLHRIAASTGPGYTFLDREHWKLRGRVGAGVSYQFVGEEDLRPEGIVGLRSIWPIDELHSIEIFSDLHPNLEDLGEYRTHSGADWNITISELLGLGLKIGVLHDYQSDTSEKNHDLIYRGLLSYSF